LAAKSAPQWRGVARIRAEAREDGEVLVETEGIASFAILSEGPPIAPGQQIKVKWNGAVLFRGEFKGAMLFPVGEQETPASAPTPAAGVQTKR